MKTIVVILAGGQGTRIRHLLPGLPKPLAPINGKPFLEWIIEFLAKQGLTDIVFSTGYLADQIKNFVSNNQLGLELRCADEITPLGTAGGVLNALDSIEGNYDNALILNGDSLTLTDLSPLFESFTNLSVGVSMVGVKVRDAGRYGTLVTKDDGFLVGFKEKQPGGGVINAGIYLFRKEVLDKLPRAKNVSLELDVFPCLLHKKVLIKVIEVEAPFIDIGTEESLLDAPLFIDKNFNYFYSRGLK
jgi:NDP-sugar pyrophosphorylase family protein